MRGLPWLERRAFLSELAAQWVPPLALCPVTDDLEVASDWFEDMAAAGIEGLVVKGASQLYTPGGRGWLKVKHREQVELVCAAVIGPIGAPTVVVAGLVLDGKLRIVGRTVPLSSTASRALGRQLEPAAPAGHPWPATTTSATVNGFGASRDPVTLTLVQPIVVQVAADVAWSGRTFRHPLRFVRTRPDLDPEDVITPAHLT